MKKEKKKEKKSLKPPDYFQWVSDFYNGSISTEDKKIIARLRKHHDLMWYVYSEIDKKLDSLSANSRIIPSKRAFPVLQAIIDAAALWEPKTKLPQRELKKQLGEVQKNIIKTTETLIALLNKHEEIQTRGRIISEAFIDIFHLIERAGEIPRLTLRFDSYIAPIIQKTRGFDERYYPNIQEALEALILEVEENVPIPVSPEDSEVLTSQKTSPADFIRFLTARLDREKLQGGTLPEKFKLSQRAVGYITKCALDFKDDITENDVYNALRYKKP